MYRDKNHRLFFLELFPAFVCLPVVATLAMVVMLAWST
nr:MAG TPA: Receptor activity modifying family [Caudoviricetes sp.]